MGMFINLIFLFLFNKLTLSEKSKNNIYDIENAENAQMQLLETTTDLSFEYNDSFPTETFIEVVELNANGENKSISCDFFNGKEFRINNDGTVYSDVLKKNITQNSYCIDNKLGFVHVSSSLSITGEFLIFIVNFCFSFSKNYFKSLNHNRLVNKFAVICYEEVGDEDDDDDDDYSQYEYAKYLKRTAIAISVFFLFILVLAYILTPHELDLQKRCTCACCGNLFLAFLILFISKTVSKYVGGDDGHKCLTLAILLQYSLLSFYFWLNINCYEIFRIIRYDPL
ncbi:hypothetical protein Avbf_10009 [Armadillidium vulgare]|nr:hypothetical protein Avbf_10009 [Armadillidium vulgare]